jgi:hypothetical protein
MDAAMKKTGVTCIIIGIVVTAIAPTTGGLVESAAIRRMGSLCAGLGTIVFLYGCVQIAKAKGQPWFYGLLGLLSCLGLAVLWFVVPDKTKA